MEHKTVKTDSNVTETFDAIHLCPAQNQRGGHQLLMEFNRSGKLITGNIIQEIPVTDVVMMAIKTMAYNQGFKSLNFKNRHGVIFHDANWIAGVDYKNNNKDEEDDDGEYHHEEA